MTSGRAFRRFLAAACALGAVVRVGYVFAFRGDEPLGHGDSYAYSVGANLLADGWGFVEPLSVLSGDPWQGANHPPLYLLWLTVASLVDPGHATSPVVHMVWTCVLGTGTVAVCGLAVAQVAGERAGMVAAAIAAVYPNLWLHDGMLLSESMAIFAAALTLWAAYRFWELPGPRRAAWLGLCCGLAALSRSELILTVPALLAPLAAMARGQTAKQRAGLLVAGGLASVVVVGPWVAFNLARFDAPVYLSTNAGGTAAAANCDSTYYGDLIGYKDYGCSDRAYARAARRDPNWNQLDVAQQDQAVRAEVRRYIGEHIERVPVVMGARVARILKLYAVRQEVDYDHRLHQQELWVVYAGLASWYPLAGLAVAGATVLRRRGALVYPLLAVPAIVLVAVAVSFAQTRYRAPAEPAVVMLAAVALEAAWSRRNPRSATAGPAARAPVEVPAAG